MEGHRAIFLPGGVMPAAPAYANVLAALGNTADVRVKDLEVYATDPPSPDWTLETEIEGIERVATEAGFDRFHLVGYSGGGAMSLLFAARRPDRLLSLALMEPAFAGWQAMTPEERTAREAFRPLLGMDGPEMLALFQRLQLAPGVEPPAAPSGPPPAWMASRPAGIRTILTASLATDLDLEQLRAFRHPVWFAFGGRSNPDYYARMATRLGRFFPDFTIQVFPDRHHFDPPHRIEPEAVAAALHLLWDRGERA